MTEDQLLGIAQEKGEIIREALIIIDKLADNTLADYDGFDSITEFGADEIDELQKLIMMARSIKDSKWWGDMLKLNNNK